jgi:hypothetical protein
MWWVLKTIASRDNHNGYMCDASQEGWDGLDGIGIKGVKLEHGILNRD